jgi:hypothetical protein
MEMCYANRFAADWLGALTSVIGSSGVNMLLGRAQAARPADSTLARATPFTTLSRLNGALDDMYTPRGGRHVALRSGRAWFSDGMRHFGAMRGVADPAFRALTVPDRCRVVLLALADIFSHFSDQATTLDEDARAFHWRTAHSPFAHGLSAREVMCQPLTGLLIEAMRWAANGRDLAVRESQCVTAGHSACAFVIIKPTS